MSLVVSDTSPLHYLILCDSIHVLPLLFERVLIPPIVAAELRNPATPSKVKTWMDHLPPWASIQAPTIPEMNVKVDAGEREAIRLARECNADFILIDDLKGRKAAASLGLAVTGTLGILEAASQRGLINLSAAIDLLRGTNARLDKDLIEALLKRERDRIKPSA